MKARICPKEPSEEKKEYPKITPETQNPFKQARENNSKVTRQIKKYTKSNINQKQRGKRKV